MQEKKLQIKNKLGLHARPAALLVQTAGKFKSKIKIVKDNQEVDGKSIMGLMMLTAEYGSILNVFADGEDEVQALEEIELLVGRKFDEE